MLKLLCISKFMHQPCPFVLGGAHSNKESLILVDMRMSLAALTMFIAPNVDLGISITFSFQNQRLSGRRQAQLVFLCACLVSDPVSIEILDPSVLCTLPCHALRAHLGRSITLCGGQQCCADDFS